MTQKFFDAFGLCWKIYIQFYAVCTKLHNAFYTSTYTAPSKRAPPSQLADNFHKNRPPNSFTGTNSNF